MGRSIGRVARFVFGAVALLLLTIFASPAVLLMALCAAPVIVAFTPWILIELWKSGRTTEHHHAPPRRTPGYERVVVYSGPIDRLHAHP